MMAFNYLNTGYPGRYPYRMPLHLIQQMDLSAAVHLPPSADYNFINNGNFSYCTPVGQQVRPQQTELDSGSSNMKSSRSDLSSIHRTVSEFSMSSASSFSHSLSLPGVHGQCQPPQQAPAQLKLVDQSQTLESCHLGKAPNKISDTGGVMCNNSPEYGNNANTAGTSTAPNESSNTKKNTKEEKDKKKCKRVRYVKPGCFNDCQRRCKQKISQNTREDLFNEFWKLENDAMRREFIARHANKMPIMTCQEGSRRSFSVDWAFHVKGESFSVCKLFFLNTLDIAEEMAYSAMKETLPVNLDNYTVHRKKAKKRKLTWSETDIDEDTGRDESRCSHKKPRCKSKKEKIAELRPGCTDLCRRNCQSKFTHEERLSIFSCYRSFSNLRRQREFIMDHVKKLERKYIRSNKATRRGCSIGWMLPLKGKKLPVCKTFFLHTVGISEHTAYSIGMQNELQPAVKIKIPKQDQPPSWSSVRSKYLKALIAKGNFKPNLRLVLKNKESLKDIGTGTKMIKHPDEKKCSSEKTCIKDNHYFPLSPRFSTTLETLVSRAARPLQLSMARQEIEENQGVKVVKPSEGVHIPLATVPTYGLRHQIGCAGSTALEYLHQQSTHPDCDPSLPHDSQHNTSNTQNSQDALLLLALKNATGDLFPDSACKDTKENVKNRSWHLVQEKLNKSSKRKVKEKKHLNKKMKEGCTESCRRKCNKIISQVAREELFDEFWRLESDVCRREYILPIVNKIPKKRNKNSDSRRGCTIEWSVPFNGELHTVCKKFFLDTFDISENFVKTVHTKIERNDGSMEDMRGKHGKRASGIIKEEKEIEKYIKSLATYKAVRCIRCNSDFPRWCFETKLSSSQLYKEYADDRKLQEGKPACRTSFTNFCAKKFNIQLSNPQEYVCDQCIGIPQKSLVTLVFSNSSGS